MFVMSVERKNVVSSLLGCQTLQQAFTCSGNVFFCFRDIRVCRPPRTPALENSRSYAPSKKNWKHWNLWNFLFYSENFCTAYILTHFLHTLEELQLLKVYLSREKHQKQVLWNAQGLQNSWKKDGKKIQFFFFINIYYNMFIVCIIYFDE